MNVANLLRSIYRHKVCVIRFMTKRRQPKVVTTDEAMETTLELQAKHKRQTINRVLTQRLTGRTRVQKNLQRIRS